MLKIITLDDAQQWDTVVRSFSQHDVYYLSGYVKGFQLHGDGEPLLIYCEAEGIRGVNVVFKRRIADDLRFAEKLEEELYDFVSPYGYGGWLLEGQGSAEALMAQYERWCRQNRIVSEFVRFHPVLKNHEKLLPFYNVVQLGCTVAMDLASEETIWANLTSKNRNMIRKAQKNGLKVYRASDPESYLKFKQVYDLTMDKDSAADYYYFGPEYYQSVWEDLSRNAQVFYTLTEDGTLAAAAIIMGANGQLHYHLSGSSRELQGLAPTNLLLYEAACWGSANGYKTLHLGGGLGAREDSLLAFKKAFFRGELCGYHVGKRILDDQAYQLLVSLRSDLPESNFFPAYRA